MSRVEVTRPVVGICYMQVCAVKDATDDEILAVCNAENPSGTQNGWGDVIRGEREPSFVLPDKHVPIACADDADRVHLLVGC
jgi:hypothetical protein